MVDMMHGLSDAERWLLRRILAGFGALPFAGVQLAEWIPEGPWTGAEIRLAIRRLVREGVLEERSPPWGDRTWRLPAVEAVKWHGGIFPVKADPLPRDEEVWIRRDAAEHRLPLSLELMLVWAALERCGGLPLTRKGGIHRPAAVRLAAEMRLTEAELAGLPLPPDIAAGGEERGADGARDGTRSTSGGLPLQLVMALDLGLECGVLKREPERIAVDPDGLSAWLALARSEADDALRALLAERYAARDSALFFAACAVERFPAGRWFRLADAAGTGADAGALETWTTFMASCGWLDRGSWRGERVFRRKKPPEEGDGRPFVLRVLPDLEVWALPEAGLRCRYELERIAERTSADEVFVYRLTQAGCARAKAFGYGREEVVSFLERESGTPLPAPVGAALADWFAETEPAASGGRPSDFRRAAPREGLPAAKKEPEIRMPSGPVHRVPLAPASRTPPGRVKTSEAPAVPKDGRTGQFPEDGLEKLFPGIGSVSPFWLRTMRRYHPSTAGLLVQQALAWRTALRLSSGGRECEFVPLGFERTADGWEARGFIRERELDRVTLCDGATDGEPPRTEESPWEVRPAVIRSADAAELRILLPPGLTGSPSDMV